jgi:hypothetical protein
VLLFQVVVVVVASGDGGILLHRSSFGGGFAPTAVSAVVWFVPCTQWEFGF